MLALLVSLLASLGLVIGAQPTWTPAGPYYSSTGAALGIGSINSISADVAFGSTYVAASNGGIWKSTNIFEGGAPSANPHWEPLTASNLCNSAASVSVSAEDPNFVAYSCAGVSSYMKASGPLYGAYISADGGSTWKLADLSYGLDLSRIHVFGTASSGVGLIIASAKGRMVPVPGSQFLHLNMRQGGIFISRDSGRSFAQVSDPLVMHSIRDTQVDYANQIVYAYDYLGNILISRDLGNTWGMLQNYTALPFANPVNFRFAIGSVAGGPNVFAMACDGNNDGVVQWSHDFGKTWKSAPAPSATFDYNGTWFMAIIADPKNQNLFYIAGAVDSVYRGDISQPAESMFTPLTGSVHPDHRSFLFHSALDLLLMSCDGGLWALEQPRTANSTAAAPSWIALNGDLQITEFGSLAYEPRTGTIGSGAQDNGVWLSNMAAAANGSDFYTFDLGDGEAVAFNSQNDPPVFYGSAQFLDQAVVYPLGSNPNNAPFLNPIVPEAYFESIIRTNVVNPKQQLLCINPSCLLVEYSDPTNPNTANQSIVFPSLNVTDYFFGGFRNGQGDANVMFAIFKNQYIFAQDSTSTNFYHFNQQWKIDHSPYGDPHIRLTHNPVNYYQVIVATTESQIYFSESFGAEWKDVTGNLFAVTQCAYQPQVWATGIMPLSNQKDIALIVGTAFGVYYSLGTSLGQWHPLGTGIPNVLISNLHYSIENKLLIAATMGRGWWTMQNPLEIIEGQSSGGDGDHNSDDSSKKALIIAMSIVGVVLAVAAVYFIYRRSLRKRSLDQERLIANEHSIYGEQQ